MFDLLKIKLAVSIIVMILLMLDLNLSYVLKFIIFAVCYLSLSYKIIYKAFNTLILRRRMNEQFLMTIATFGAIYLQDLSEALAIMIFYLIGQTFEDYAKAKSHKEITSLIKLKPSVARVVNADGSISECLPRKVKIGTVVRVLAGDSVPLDGVLISDNAILDTSAVNGESQPYHITQGQNVLSGCINKDKVFDFKVSKRYSDSQIARLIALVEDSVLNKSKPEALISRFAAFYTPVVVTMAALLAIAPFIIDGLDKDDWINRALIFLVISCPCALVLSVPLSFFGGLGAISKIGVMVKGSIFIEILARLKAIALDKTGTLTKGELSVENFICHTDEQQVLAYVKALEQNSNHPIATALVKYCDERGVNACELSEIQEQAGLGIQGFNGEHHIYIGNGNYIQKKLKLELENQHQSGPVVYVAQDDALLAVIELSDSVKEEAIVFIKSLDQLGIKPYMITGDKQQAAQAIANKIKLDSNNVYSECLPEQKLTTVQKLKHDYHEIAFIGDGINDAPVLSNSDVGIAMGKNGSALAVEASDVVVMNDDLLKIIKAIKISKKTYKLAIENIVLIIGVKALILALGAFGFANIWLAILGDVGLLIISILNSMRSLAFARIKA